MVVTVCSHLRLVKPNSHAVRREILHTENSLLYRGRNSVKIFFVLCLKTLILTEPGTVRANVALGDGRVNKAN